MNLRLSAAHAAEYELRAKQIRIDRDQAIKFGYPVMAKRYRQRLSALYEEFKGKQIPEDQNHIDANMFAYEANLTMEQRVERIERVLKLGLYKE